MIDNIIRDYEKIPQDLQGVFWSVINQLATLPTTPTAMIPMPSLAKPHASVLIGVTAVTITIAMQLQQYATHVRQVTQKLNTIENYVKLQLPIVLMTFYSMPTSAVIL